MTERTFVMVKPDGVQRGLIGEIIARFEDRGLKLVGAKLMRIDQALAEEHYAEHTDKPFFEDLTDFITSGPVLAMVWEGQDAIAQVRTMMGATDPAESAPGTIRGDFGLDMGRNVIHGSDTEPGSAEREIELFFDEEELEDYERIDEAWLYE
ncbi:nucleoside diphosphate kinase [Halodesulfurarchaeum formicicum]|uniref:Nucleoside diphosphate kinase n=1 Tax=Halodesulfurarchaeum formicicum TaxID=1873524 RepID=A0A1D8S3L0_9EURY|nr:nucleoside-diphosphate kinase [Halodesulfurarchaeum formicicum]AOW79946.1 nucleoside diphosphate kinase [Halodesulfurarchaeum formicicum]APE95239.1 nucleoside-diphosphate kinase [Halodesulfurarchaeum formicicum]